MTKERLDVLLCRQGLAESRDQAQRIIRAGRVRADGAVAAKPGRRYALETRLERLGAPRFVSRGGEKLQAALETFDVDVCGQVCLDVGASTGGFTDCLLQNGARRVYAVDVGKGLLHWKLRNDARVVVMECRNARYLRRGDLPEEPAVAAVDCAFISLTLVIPAVVQLLARPAVLLLLIKPQFEAGREQVGRGGVVRDPAVRAAVVDRIRGFVETVEGMEWCGVRESPLKGPAGNVEFVACCRRLRRSET